MWSNGSQQPRSTLTAGRPSPFQRACQVLRRTYPFAQNSDMETKRDLVTRAGELPLHPQDEVACRRCGVHCDKVVYPAACVERACPLLYAYAEFGSTYVGCMQKVYEVENDLDLLREAEGRKGGFGGVKETKRPLPMCRAEVESC